jgi:hypothetical protein
MRARNLSFAWRPDDQSRRFKTGVSIHSHTSYSPERLAGRIPWKPPLAPREAYELEARQIERTLGLRAIVSLTDHDSIEAPLELRMQAATRDVPVSLEWTVPFAGAELHFGLHALPPRSAQLRMHALKAYTARPEESQLPALFEWLAEDPETLIVFNHPLWDERCIGRTRHNQAVQRLLQLCRPWIHALELNGLRTWRENRRVIELSSATRLPVIAGGDRHGKEPNAILNLSDAVSFAEFVDEVRTETRSHVLVMPQFRNPLALRIANVVAEVIWAAVPRPAFGGVRVPESI